MGENTRNLLRQNGGCEYRRGISTPDYRRCDTRPPNARPPALRNSPPLANNGAARGLLLYASRASESTIAERGFAGRPDLLPYADRRYRGSMPARRYIIAHKSRRPPKNPNVKKRSPSKETPMRTKRRTDLRPCGIFASKENGARSPEISYIERPGDAHYAIVESRQIFALYSSVLWRVVGRAPARKLGNQFGIILGAADGFQMPDGPGRWKRTNPPIPAAGYRMSGV